jgi:hypothetical protein
MARNERIQNLEVLLQDADRRLAVQNQKFEVQLQAVKERLDQARGERRRLSVGCDPCLRPWARDAAQKAAAGSTLNFGRIAKPLRGGGGNAAAVTAPTPISGGGGSASSANPLARLQNEEGCVFHVARPFCAHVGAHVSVNADLGRSGLRGSSTRGEGRWCTTRARTRAPGRRRRRRAVAYIHTHISTHLLLSVISRRTYTPSNDLGPDGEGLRAWECDRTEG